MSRIALGTAFFGVAPTEKEASSLLSQALDAGITFIDTANSYGNQARFDRKGSPAAADRASAEEIIGNVIGSRRDDFVIGTKVSEPVGNGPNDGSYDGGGLSRLHIMRMVERSLRRLRTDYIDVYYAHHPDPVTSIEDTLLTFEDLIRQGKIRYYALSRYSGWQVAEVMLMARNLGVRSPLCHQVRYSLNRREVEHEVLACGRHFGLDAVAFGALGGGLFAGDARFRKYSGNARFGGPGFSSSELGLAERVVKSSQAWGYSSAQVALAWVLAQPGIASAIVGPESAGELAELEPAVQLTLTEEQLAELTADQGDLAGPRSR